MKRLFAAPLLALLLAFPAQAHKLVIFAYVDNGEIVVETKFSSGSLPAEGTIQVLDAEGMEITTLEMEADGETRFPIPENHKGGVQVNVATRARHAATRMSTDPSPRRRSIAARAECSRSTPSASTTARSTCGWSSPCSRADASSWAPRVPNEWNNSASGTNGHTW